MDEVNKRLVLILCNGARGEANCVVNIADCGIVATVAMVGTYAGITGIVCSGERWNLGVVNVAHRPACALCAVRGPTVSEPERTVQVGFSILLDSQEGDLTGVNGKVPVVARIVALPHFDL